MSSALSLLIALFVNKHDSFIKAFFYTCISGLNNWANFGMLQSEYIERDATIFTNFLELIIFIAFLVLARRIFRYQRDLIWLSKARKHDKDDTK